MNLEVYTTFKHRVNCFDKLKFLVNNEVYFKIKFYFLGTFLISMTVSKITSYFNGWLIWDFFYIFEDL